MISLSYALPAYNEEEILDDTIAIVLRDLESLGDVVSDFELIVVDDCSTDRTASIAERWVARDPRVRLLRHERNRGVGEGILTALRNATKEWYSVNCADRPFDTRDIRRLDHLFDQSDVIVVARTDRRANSPYRKLTSTVNYLLIKLLFGIPADDYQFVQFYRVAALRDLQISSRGTAVPPEMIMRLWKKGARISQVRLPFHPRPGGVAKYGHPKYYVHTLLELARLRLQVWKEGFA